MALREIVTNSFFPFANKSKNVYLQNISILSIGGNLKNPIKTFLHLIRKLRLNRNITLISTSPIYKNPPFGYTKQRDFYNSTIILSTNMCLIEFYRFVFYTERIFGRGRKREFKNAPRILDIDILFFNDIFIRSEKLNIPHLHWNKRDSVLIPLLYQVNYKGF